MGYLVADVVQRARLRHGVIVASDWRSFLSSIGIDYMMLDLPDWLSAVLVDSTVVVRRGMSPEDVMKAVWHEVGHVMLHEGDESWWLNRPQGWLTVRKYDWQASEFAALFPIWEESSCAG